MPSMSRTPRRSPRMRGRLGVCVVAAVAALNACGARTGTSGDGPAGDPGSDPRNGKGLAALAGRTFVSGPATDPTAERPAGLPARATVRLDFTTDGIGADAGCNRLGGEAGLDDGVLVVGALSGTEMGCAPDLMAADAWLADFLAARPSVTLDGDTLTLTTDAGSLRLTEPTPAPLEGTTWRVEALLTGAGLAEGSASSLPPTPRPVTVRFATGRVEVSTGCNRGAGSYELAADRIDLGPVVTTRLGCSPEVMKVENAVLAVLDGSPAYTLDADGLLLRIPDGAGLQLVADTGMTKDGAGTGTGTDETGTDTSGQ